MAGPRAFRVRLIDIWMPKKDGAQALKEIRALEEAVGLWPGRQSARIVMTTSAQDAKIIVGAFREQCDAYLVKPVSDERLRAVLNDLGLTPS